MTAAGPDHRAHHVLIVDDEPEIGELIAAAAQAVGMRSTVTTGYEAFRAALTPEVDLLVIDLMLPDVDGIEILRHLGKARCRSRILLMSGFDRKVLATAEGLAQSLGLDIAGRLLKPFRVAEAETLLVGAMASATPAAAPKRVADELDPEALRRALETGAIVVHYQPQIELVSGRLAGVEALVRLRGADGTLIYPDSFIGVAERSGQIETLTVAVLRRSVGEIGPLALSGLFTLSINVSALTLTDIELPDRLGPYVVRHGMQPQSVVMEITESGLIKELSTALDILARLRLKGFGLSIDDFGTGFSSMAQLRRIPATELKIDRQFVDGMLSDASAAAVAVKTIELGHELGMKVVAEGIETADQAAALREKHCDIGQGYYYAKPLPLDELKRWIS